MNQQNSFNEERRKHPRTSGNLPLKLCGDDFDVVTETKNLSRSGAYCQATKYIEPMTKVRVQLLLPFKKKDKVVTKKVSCEGVVVRTESIPDEKVYNLAIYFHDISSRDGDCISQYVNQNLKKEQE